MRFTAKIENGEINWHDERALAEHLNLIDTKECYIDIKTSKVRNTAQNNYYWAILRDWGKDIGDNDVNYMHDLAKAGYRKAGYMIDSIKELDKGEFSEYLFFVEEYARVHGWKDNQGMKIKHNITRLP